MFWKKKKNTAATTRAKLEEKPVEKYTDDGCKINEFGYRMLMAYPKDIDYDKIPVSNVDYYSVYKNFFEPGMVGCMTSGFSDKQCGDYSFHILSVQRLMNYAASATVKLEYLKKQAVEWGIAHYDSSGHFQLNEKNPEIIVDKTA